MRKLRSGAMPPAGMPRPAQADLDAMAGYLETTLDRAAAAQPNPGRPAIRRLTRTEYGNAIRDLLAVDIDAAALLPADDSRFGFDNIGSVLTLSPLLAERYLAAARQVRRLALGDAAIRPTFEFYDVSKDLMQEDRVGEGLPFGSRGGIAIRHHFPADGEYIFRVRLQRNSREYIRGMQQPHDLDIRLDGARISRITVGGERKGRSSFVFSSASMGDVAQEHYERTADEALEVRHRVGAGSHVISASFAKEDSVPERPLEPRMTMYDYAQYKGGEAAVASLAIGGPYSVNGVADSTSRQKVFVCRPASVADEEPCARRILSALAHRAYRRPAGNGDVETLLGLYRTGRRDGSFDAGIGLALERMLAGPEFLFRIERDPAGIAAGTAYRVSDLELASRLSFFLWSSVPDDELLELAERGRLKDPAVLERQVRRMLADDRARSLVTSFAAQWLHLRNVDSVTPDLERFPYFDENLRDAFRTETELFFESMLREDRSVLDLLAADYTFLNERLARHYGIPGVYGSHFRRVRLPDASRARTARPRQHPDGHVVPDQDLTSDSRQVGARQHPRHAAATATAECSGIERARRPGQSAVGARPDGTAPGESGVRDVSQADGSAGLRARKLRRRRAGGARPTRACRLMRRVCSPTARAFRGLAELRERAAAETARAVRLDRDGQAAHLRARPRRRILRRARRSAAS